MTRARHVTGRAKGVCLFVYKTPWRGGGGGKLTHIWAIQGCAAQQGIVFASLTLEQGIKITLSQRRESFLCHV